MTTHRAAGRLAGRFTGRLVGLLAVVLALLAVQGSPAGAQAGKGLIDPNTAAESDLQSLPAMTPAIVKGMMERRPFKSVIELNKFLLDQKVTPEQAREFYRKAFVPININTGTRDEFMLIPGVGSRMSAEFMEYRPWKNWTQFDKEIGKYVGQPETDRFKQYVFIPPS
jgi:DNA uptake protein ComE-like DNA-binding protein